MRVAVLGAGLAGLAAGCELADLGHEVTVLERRPWAGGKTYSFTDEETGAAVDNGQHVFMACTTEYIAFLRRLGTLELTRRQERLRVRIFDQDGRVSQIVARDLPPPFHLARSLLHYRGLSAVERLRAGKALSAARRLNAAGRERLADQSLADWLRAHRQSERVISRLWDFLVLPTLNCRAAQASARDALFVLHEGFLASSTSSAIGVAAVGLSNLHVVPAVRYIESRGGSVVTGARVRSIAHAGGRFTGVVTEVGPQEFDACVCALPPWDVPALLNADLTREEPFASLAAFEPSPIINLHVWFARPVADFEFAAFTGCELQWVFNRNYLDLEPEPTAQHLVISLSGAGALMDLDKGALAERLVPQLRRALRIDDSVEVTRVLAIKEPAATFIPAPGLRRPGTETPVENLVLAGAHVDTGWPATMESAVRSGLMAARSLQARWDELEPVRERSCTDGHPNQPGDRGQLVPVEAEGPA